jgi:hypothetical protein
MKRQKHVDSQTTDEQQQQRSSMEREAEEKLKLVRKIRI